METNQTFCVKMHKKMQSSLYINFFKMLEKEVEIMYNNNVGCALILGHIRTYIAHAER